MFTFYQAIPIVMEGKDIVAMARTGSGKTAAFLIPMFEKLKVHSAQSGARALILSPTRELALQTLKFTKEVIISVIWFVTFTEKLEPTDNNQSFYITMSVIYL